MKRTLGDQQRRCALMDAASDSVSRAVVALYACIPPDHHEGVILPKIREYVAARDWTILEEVIDHVPLHTPMNRREAWHRVKNLVERGQAAGVVTPEQIMCGCDRNNADHLDQWVTRLRTFAAAPSALLDAPCSAREGTR